MKTLQNINTGKLKREHEVVAQSLVDSGNWKYVPKSVFKQNINGEESKIQSIKPLKNKSNKMSKAMKRHLRRKK